MIKQLLCAALLTTVFGLACADDVRPVNGWVPKGWKLLKQETGDLNGDGEKDVVAVFEQTDPKKLKKNDNFGPGILNTNPRTLLVLFAEKGAYRKVAENATLVPPANDEESSCHEDPLEDVKIQKGVLKLALSDWMSCGGWSRSDTSYTFRYDGKGMRLIGKDESTFQRNSGMGDSTSTNYLSGKIKRVVGEVINAKGKISWQTMQSNPAIYLEQLE